MANRKWRFPLISMIRRRRKWRNPLIFDMGRRRSELCKAKDLYTDWYKRWKDEMHEIDRIHRKPWEWIYIMQALWERDCIVEGKRGLAFAVGTEPCPSVLANYGVHVLATDNFPEKENAIGWSSDGQFCFGIESLNTRNLCSNETLKKYVTYRPVDMNDIPDDLTNFDFNWSSCSFEHLGSIDKGLAFLKNQLKTLKPGGWAVHTTEFNISSNDLTVDKGPTVVFRLRDIEKIVAELQAEGHFVEELDTSIGGLPQDFHVDVVPYKSDIHLKLRIGQHVVTSIGLIIRKKI